MHSMPGFVRRNSLTIALCALILVMGAEILFLVRQNRRLQSMLAHMPPMQVLQQGQSLPPLSATDIDGAGVAMRYGEREPSTVLIWFSPSCHLCAENAPFWNGLYDRFRASQNVRFLVMSDSGVDETRAYMAESHLKLPVVCVTDESLLDAYNGRVMPQTALISPRGAIEKVWPGALEETRQIEITAVLDSLTI